MTTKKAVKKAPSKKATAEEIITIHQARTSILGHIDDHLTKLILSGTFNHRFKSSEISHEGVYAGMYRHLRVYFDSDNGI